MVSECSSCYVLWGEPKSEVLGIKVWRSKQHVIIRRSVYIYYYYCRRSTVNHRHSRTSLCRTVPKLSKGSINGAVAAQSSWTPLPLPPLDPHLHFRHAYVSMKLPDYPTNTKTVRAGRNAFALFVLYHASYCISPRVRQGNTQRTLHVHRVVTLLLFGLLTLYVLIWSSLQLASILSLYIQNTIKTKTKELTNKTAFIWGCHPFPAAAHRRQTKNIYYILGFRLVTAISATLSPLFHSPLPRLLCLPVICLHEKKEEKRVKQYTTTSGQCPST